jgi:hypothetical protein
MNTADRVKERKDKKTGKRGKARVGKIKIQRKRL